MSGKSEKKVKGRWWRRLLKAGLFIFALALVGVLVAPKMVARQVLQTALVAAELEPFSFDVVSVDLQKLVLADLVLGAGPDLQVDQIEVSYTINDLWRGKVSGIRLLRPKWQATAAADKTADREVVSFGVFDSILFDGNGAGAGPGVEVTRFSVEEGEIILLSPDGLILTTRFDAAFVPGGASEFSFAAAGGPKTSDLSIDGRLSAVGTRIQSARLQADIPRFDVAGWYLEDAELQLDFDKLSTAEAGKLEIQIGSFAFPNQWLGRFEKYLKSSDMDGDWIDGFDNLAITARASVAPDEGGISGKLSEPFRVSRPDGAIDLVLSGQQDVATDFRLAFSDEWSLDVNVRAEQSGAWLPLMDLSVDTTLTPPAAGEESVGIVVRRLAGRFDGLQFGRLRIGSRDLAVVGDGSLRRFAGTAKGGLLINGQLGQAFAFEESVAQLDGSFQLRLPGGISYTHEIGACAELASQNFRVIQLYLPNSKLNFCPDRERPVMDLVLGAGDASQMSLAAIITGDNVSITDQDRFDLNGMLPTINLSADFDVDEGKWSMTYALDGGSMIFGDRVSLLDKLGLKGSAQGSSNGIENVEMDLAQMQVSSAGTVELFAPFLINGAMRTQSRLGRFSGDLFDMAQRQMGGYEGEHDWRTQGGFLQFDTGELVLEPKGFQPQILFPVFADVMADARGAMRATGLIDWKDGSLTSNGDVELIDIDFASLVGPVSGVDSRIKLGSLLPLATLAPQRIDIQQVDVGIDLFFGEFLFSLMADGRVVLEEAVWPWAGGEIGFDRAALILDENPQELNLFVRSVDLADVFALLDIDGLTGSGFLEGQLPIRVEDGGITVLDGVMKSLGGGTLKYEGPVSLSTENEDGSKLMFDALENFTYESLEVSISGRTTDDLKVAILLEGSNPAVLDGYPFKINISTEGPLAEMVREGTIGYRVPEQIRKQLQ